MAELEKRMLMERSKSISSQSKQKKSSSKIQDEWNKKYGALYQAAKKYSKEEFNDVLKQVLKEDEELSLLSVFSNVNESEDTLLHVAVNYGNAETLGLIGAKFPCLLRKKNAKGNTVWHAAAKTPYVEVFKELFILRNHFINHLSYSSSDIGSNIEVTWEDVSLREVNNEGNTALHVALINRRESMADQLVKEDWDLSYYVNKENKSAFYLAAESGLKTLKLVLKDDASSNYAAVLKRLKGESLVHAAIMGRHEDVLEFLLEKELVLRDEEKWAPFHWAASIGFLKGIQYLVEKYSVSPSDTDENGLYPIHLASMNGHVDVVRELLKDWKGDWKGPDNLLTCDKQKGPDDLLTLDKQNVLHVATKSGQHNVVSYILKTPELVCLINMKDEHGNTPLHCAAMKWHPRIVNSLTWDNSVDLNSKNEDGLTPLDAAESNMKGISSFRQWLTWQVLKVAGAQQGSSAKVIDAEGQTSSTQSKLATAEYYKDRKKTFLSMSILVGIVSFISTLPGAYINSETDHATMIISTLRHIKFHLFMFCAMTAMSSSIVVAAALFWAHLGEVNDRVFNALRFAKPLLAMALTMMSLALLSGMYLVLGKVHWLVDIILTTGLVFLVSFATLFFPLCFPFSSGYRILQYITYYPIRLMIFSLEAIQG